MKIRNGFVTNSSSSSFLLAFKNENDYNDFVEYCNDFDYKSIKELVEDFIKQDKEKSREVIEEEAISFVTHTLTWKQVSEWLKEKIGIVENFKVYLEKEKELRETQEFKDFYNELIHQETIQNKIKEIHESEILCSGMIWDTNGGIMEWAIRNGFLEREFYQWCVLVQNVG